MQAERNTSPAAWTLATPKQLQTRSWKRSLEQPSARQQLRALPRSVLNSNGSGRCEAAVADQFALARKECELEKTEDVALFALEAYERADKQRTELYYQAKSSNALAAKTLMESLDDAGGERCKALAKQRKFQVVAQAKELRLTVKPHLTAAVQGHKPFTRPGN